MVWPHIFFCAKNEKVHSAFGDVIETNDFSRRRPSV
jgi:hypothetical protein